MRHLVFIAMLVPAFASAEIYRWTDAQGRVHFSEKPGVTGAEQVEVKPQVVERDDATRQREQRTQQYFDARRDERAVAGTRSAEARAKRNKECQELRSNLESIQRDQRYFVIDKDGNKSYVEADEIDSARSRLSSRIAERCG
jgi:hypothetical protein